MFRMILSSVVMASVLVGANVNAQVGKPVGEKPHAVGKEKPNGRVIKDFVVGGKAEVDPKAQAERNEALARKVEGLTKAADAKNVTHLSNNSGADTSVRGEAAKSKFLKENGLHKALNIKVGADGKVTKEVDISDLNRVEELARRSPARFEGLDKALSQIGKVAPEKQAQFTEFARAMFICSSMCIYLSAFAWFYSIEWNGYSST